METKVTIDQTGRVLIPKALRDQLRLGSGDQLALSSEGEEIRLHPVRSKPQIKREKGVWVYQGDPAEATSISELIDREREKRIQEAIG